METSNNVLVEKKDKLSNTKVAEVEKYAQLALIALVFSTPTMAHAAPWDDMADTILDLLTNGFTRTIAIIVCIGLGIAAWTGKLTWGMAGRFIGGIVFIFGSVAIVDLFIDAV